MIKINHFSILNQRNNSMPLASWVDLHNNRGTEGGTRRFAGCSIVLCSGGTIQISQSLLPVELLGLRPIILLNTSQIMIKNTCKKKTVHQQLCQCQKDPKQQKRISLQEIKEQNVRSNGMRMMNGRLAFDLLILLKLIHSITMNEEPDNLTRILHMFKSYNCNEETLLTKEELANILDQQAKNKLGRPFSPQIVREIWGQAETNSRGESTMRTFAKILNNAVDILESRLYRISSPEAGIPHFQQELQKKKSLLNQLEAEYDSGFLQNYEKINVQRKNKVILETKIRELQHNRKEFTRDLEQIKACIDAPPIFPVKQAQPTLEQSQVVEEQQFIERDLSVSFDRRPNPSLLAIFYMSVIGLLLQLLVLTLKPNFLALLCYACIIYWLFLGYYDRHFVTYLIGGLGVSLILDVIYVLLMMLEKVNTNRPSTGAFGVFIVIFLVVELALRVVLIAKLFAFRDPPQKAEYFQFMGQDIELNLRAGKKEHLSGTAQ